MGTISLHILQIPVLTIQKPEMPLQKTENLTLAHTFVHEAADQKTWIQAKTWRLAYTVQRQILRTQLCASRSTPRNYSATCQWLNMVILATTISAAILWVLWHHTDGLYLSPRKFPNSPWMAVWHLHPLDKFVWLCNRSWSFMNATSACLLEDHVHSSAIRTTFWSIFLWSSLFYSPG